MPAPSRVALSLSFALAFSLAGCNEGKSVGGHDADPHAPATFGVRGAVTFQDNAVTDGQVTFTPVNGGKPLTARITNGSYELQAPPGTYRVTVTGKAGDADVPSDLAVERPVNPDTDGNLINLNLPEAASKTHEVSTPEEVRRTGTSEHPEK